MSQSPELVFTSLAFPIEPGEDEATNPGIYGKALSHWLGEKLRQRNLPAVEVIAEDFGWCLRVGAKSDRLYIACASDQEHRGQWRLYVFQDKGVLAGLFGRSRMSEAVTDLFAEVKETLQAAPEVQDLREDAQ